MNYVTARENFKSHFLKFISLPSRGFTLIELLIVIGIIGLLTSITIAAYSSYTRNQKFTNTINDVFNTLQVAKSRASSQYAPSGSCFPKTSPPFPADEAGSPGLTDYRVTSATVGSTTTVTLSANCYDSTGATRVITISSMEVPSGISVTPQTLIFSVIDGSVTPTSGTMPVELTIQQGTQQKKIQVEASGKITFVN